MNTYKLDRTLLFESKKPFNVDVISESLLKDDAKLFEKRKRLFIYIFLFEESNISRKIKTIIEEIVAKDDLFHILKPDLLKVDKTMFKKEMMENFKKNEENLEELQNLEMGLKIFETLQSEKIQELYLISDSADIFFNKYPFMNENIPLYSGILNFLNFYFFF